ncbi:hypothetical protein NL108_011071 [Boleophthalmus pectinirostris]|nr:hypothetical protein NL108_011071 [Boleophthalmus pectinirostris]
MYQHAPKRGVISRPARPQERETEALSRQAGKLSERGQARLDQIEDASERVRDFYRLVSELQSMLGRAEEGLEAQAVVGTEVDTIKQQLHEFKVGRAFWFKVCTLSPHDLQRAFTVCD